MQLMMMMILFPHSSACEGEHETYSRWLEKQSDVYLGASLDTYICEDMIPLPCVNLAEVKMSATKRTNDVHVV